MKMTETRWRALVGAHLGFYYQRPSGRLNCKAPEGSALRDMVDAGLIEQLQGPGRFTLTDEGHAAMNRGVSK